MGFIGQPARESRSTPKAAPRPTDEALREVLSSLMEERQAILQEDKLSPKDKISLLESNRKALVIARGGSIRKTENIVYSILIFSSVVIVTLSLLTAFAQLPAEVTLSFVGTVVGGTVTIIAQKLNKI